MRLQQRFLLALQHLLYGKRDIPIAGIGQYTSESHFCPECNTEMQRDVSTMGCMSIDKTGDFYRRIN